MHFGSQTGSRAEAYREAAEQSTAFFCSLAVKLNLKDWFAAKIPVQPNDIHNANVNAVTFPNFFLIFNFVLEFTP